MAAQTVTDRISPYELIRLAKSRRVTADNYKMGGETSPATTFTVTFVVTPGSTPTGYAITCDYSST